MPKRTTKLAIITEIAKHKHDEISRTSVWMLSELCWVSMNTQWTEHWGRMSTIDVFPIIGCTYSIGEQNVTPKATSVLRTLNAGVNRLIPKLQI